jgi:hypothetical protein
MSTTTRAAASSAGLDVRWKTKHWPLEVDRITEVSALGSRGFTTPTVPFDWPKKLLLLVTTKSWISQPSGSRKVVPTPVAEARE